MFFRLIPRLPLLALALVWATSTGGSAARGQEAETVEPAPVISPEIVRSRLQTVEADTSLDEPLRQRLAELYRQILTDLEATKVLEQSRQQWLQRTEDVPSRLADINRQLETWSDEVTPPDEAEYTLEDLDKRVSQLASELESARAKLKGLQEDDTKQRIERPLKAPEQLASLAERQTAMERQRDEMATRSEEPQPLRDALQLAFDVKLKNLQLEADAIKGELAFYEASRGLRDKQLELAQKSVARADAEYKAWETVAERLRSERAARDIAEKETKAIETSAELQPMAEKNLALSKELQRIVQAIKDATDLIAMRQEQATEWGGKLMRVRKVIDVQAGVTEEVGSTLRDQRFELSADWQSLKQSRSERDTLYGIRSKEFAISEELRQFSDFEQQLATAVEQHLSHVSPERVAALKPEIRALLTDRQKTLVELQPNYRTYVEKLTTLSIQEESLITLFDQYTTYIDAKILWIRSVPPINKDDLLAVPAGIRWLVQPKLWTELGRGVWGEVRRNMLLHMAIALLLIVCFGYRLRGSGEIQVLGERASAKGCRDYGVTVRALLWTWGVSAAGPGLLTWLAWTLGNVAENEEIRLAGPLAAATLASAVVYWPISFWRKAIRNQGLAESHFDWHQGPLRLTRWHLKWFAPATVTLTAIFYFYSETKNPDWEKSQARLTLVALCSCIAVFLWFMFSPERGMPRSYLARNREGWWYRLRYFWYFTVLAIPVSFALLTLLGYQYTAERLTQYLFWSAVYLSALAVLEEMSKRWILISRRRLSIAQAKQRLLASASALTEKHADESPARVTENLQVDLIEVDQQTRRLVASFVFAAAAVGLFFIWVEALPALDRLNDVRLWRYTEPATAATTATTPAAAALPTAGGATPAADPMLAVLPTSPRDSEGWVTLGNLLGSIVLLTLTVVAVRNIPGLMEIAILQHLPLDASIRYAITTVARYAIILVGSVWVFGNIGISWSKIQWLAAAVSVGLGFGLQEIFANFVSGLILLFERPLRAGDVVTVGDITGSVVRIRTRATTIRNWDQKDLIVPNKEFITGKLLNWTLTDQINRITIAVGVAYGSDIKRAREIVRSIAASHELVMQDPAPTVTCDLLGDSSVNLTLRCMLARMDDRLVVINDLHETIHDRLAAAGISIPFPQRDVHLHVASDGDVVQALRSADRRELGP